MDVDSDMEFLCFIDIDSSRSYIDDLYSEDKTICSKAMVRLKNAVIGSNRQKGLVIFQGIVPHLKAVLSDESNMLSLRLDSAIVIGSLAKGTQQHINSLVHYGVVDLFLDISIANSTPPVLMEACLNTLKTIMQHPFAPYKLIHANVQNISRLIQIASDSHSYRLQSYITHILIPMSNTEEQINLYHAGVLPFLTKLIISNQPVLQIPGLKCLASVCYRNKAISDVVCTTTCDDRTILEILTSMLSRIQLTEIQLSAAKCLTYIYRSGSVSSKDSIIVYKTVPCLARLCTIQYDDETRGTAADVLAYLTEVDSDLQRLAAISNHLIDSLSSQLKSNNVMSKKGGFKCLASISSNDENIRKRIIELNNLMKEILAGLQDSSVEVRLAAVRLLHSLSRSVQLLRTTFKENFIWRPLIDILNKDSPPELLSAVTSTICNLLLEFSPAKEPLLESGTIELLCKLTQNSDSTLKLNGTWALMNMAFQADLHVKQEILNNLGTDNILRLLCDQDTKIIMKTLGLLRNLLSNSQHIEAIMADHYTQLMKAINLVLEANHSVELKEQALCIVGNIAAVSNDKDYILDDEKLMRKVAEIINDENCKIQQGGIFVIGNLLHNKKETFVKLNRYDIMDKLELLQDTVVPTQLNEEIKQTLKKYKSENE